MHHTIQAAPWVDGLTIGQALRETARRHPQRDAFVFCNPPAKMTWGEFDAAVDRVARGLVGARVCAGRSLWRLGDERAGVGAPPIRHGADRRRAGQHQSRVPDGRTEIRAAPVRCPRAGARRCLQVVELFRHAQRSLSGARGGCARRAAKRDVSETAVGRVAPRRAAARRAVVE